MKKNLLPIVFLLFAINLSAQFSQEQVKSLLIQTSNGNDEDFTGFVITNQYKSANNGVTHIYLRQTINGIEIFNSNSALHLSKEGTIIKFDNEFIQDAKFKTNNSTPSLSYYDAVQSVASSENLLVNFTYQKQGTNPQEWVISDRKASSEDLKVKLYYLFIDGSLKLIWNVEVLNDQTGDWWNKRVDAKSGQIIDQNNWTTHCKLNEIYSAESNSSYSFSFADEDINLGKAAGSASYFAVPMPIESPGKGKHQLLTDPYNTAASPFGWHDTDGVVGADFTITRGNNVWAKDDTLGTNGLTGFSPNGTSSLTFDFPFDTTWHPRAYLSNAITNLFVWNNFMHDVFHFYGFNEESGNFQNKNYSGKGLANDYVYADAQDGSGTGNANFATPNDGSKPRMQMYLWPTSTNTNNLQILFPSKIAKSYSAPMATFGPKLTVAGITGNLVIARDSTSNPTQGCYKIINDTAVAGKIAIIDRGGTCSFTTKVLNAQNAGAIAVIVVQNSSSSPTAMSGTAPTITIPSVMVHRVTGDSIKKYLLIDSVTAKLSDAAAAIKTFDSDLDNGVISHEYGHGISNRLTGGPANSNCLTNQEQMGEGWSDFFALAMTARSDENTTLGRGIGTYLIKQDSSGLGIRPYKYSRSMAINPANYDHIKTLSIPHGVGFVWASMLWDIYWDMVDRYGFDSDIYNGKGGNNKAIQLVMDGLKLQKCSPGFVDGRDAILLADSLNNGFANHDLLWKAFARRGLGLSANQGLSSSRSDGTASWDVPALRTGINELNDFDFRVFPNPSNGIFNIESTSENKILSLEVLNITGTKVLDLKNKNGLQSINLDMNNSSKGVYILKIETSRGSICKKLFVN